MEPELILLLQHLDESPVTVNDICKWTKRDPLLAQVLQFVEQGWPHKFDSSLAPYSSRSTELLVLDGCILWGARVVIPPQGQQAVLQELHTAHPGMTRMKALARMYVWWPGLDTDIEESVRLCDECQLNQSNPPLAPLNPWNWPTRPWARLHLDYAGPFQGHFFLIIIDAHSKWIEAFPATLPSSNVTIELLRPVFAQFGVPETVVSDNGSCFISDEFQQFLKSNVIKQITSAPYHPSTNGLAEKAVQIVKKGLKKTTTGSLKSRLAKILLAYRTTPHSTTGNTPAKLLLGRNLRTRLDLLKPNTAAHVESKQWNQKVSHDNSIPAPSFTVGQPVLIRVYGQNHKWTHGSILKSTGPLCYVIKLPNGSTCRRYQDQLKSCREQVTAPAQNIPDTVPPDLLTVPTTVLSTAGNLQTSNSTVRHRYLQRTRRPPNKYSS